MNVEAARAQFPVLARLAYLNAGSMGPLARATVEAMGDRQLRDLEQGRTGRPYYDDMFQLRERVRAALAGTISVPAGNVALTASTTEGCNIVLAGLRLRPDDEVVTTDTEHFGLLGALHASGATVRVARVREQPLEQAVDTVVAQVTPRTRLVALSHVSWQNGNLLPVEEIQEATGLPMLVDGAQTAGAIAVDAARFDFYTLSGQKWLCGPDSTGGLYVRDPEALHVALPTYFSQEGYEETGAFTPRRGAARFDGGWIPTASLAGLEAALGTIPHWAAHHSADVAARCWALLSERFTVVTAPGQANLVSFVPDGDPAEVVRRLAERGVVIRDLPGTGWARVSCGWWTNDADLERLIDSL
ncbi:MAG TPA: aminotransferase class V-fold PLP-dependent enzyme [Gaiellaceae bacterium]|nr:aminotransferase class V-fold PLP-dependent enzyme [Gaiellaceae bacterium]